MHKKLLFLTIIFTLIFAGVLALPAQGEANIGLRELESQKERIASIRMQVLSLLSLVRTQEKVDLVEVLEDLFARTRNIEEEIEGRIEDIEKYTLTVYKKGYKDGYVYTTCREVRCPSGVTEASREFEAGEEVTIVASIGREAQFVRWEGDCSGTDNRCTVVIDRDKTVIAQLEYIISPEYTLIFHKYGLGGGVVESSPPGILCEYEFFSDIKRCYHDFSAGSTVTLKATPDENTKFINWRDCSEVEGNICKVIMTQERRVSARFEEKKPFVEMIYPSKETIVSRGEKLEIKWKQREMGGKRIGIYLESYNKEGGAIWSEEKESAFGGIEIIRDYYAEGENYLWHIPHDLEELFPETPHHYKIKIAHTDYGQPLINARSEKFEIN